MDDDPNHLGLVEVEGGQSLLGSITGIKEAISGMEDEILRSIRTSETVFLAGIQEHRKHRRDSDPRGEQRIIHHKPI